MNEPANNHINVEVVDGSRPAPASLSERVRSLRLPTQPSGERSRASRLPWALCFLFAASSAYLGYHAYANPAAPAAKADTDKELPQTSPGATAGSGGIALESKGYIIPAHQIQVSPKVGGMVLKLLIEEGMHVKKGDVLAELETDDYQADHDHAVGALEAARERLRELENGSRPEEIKQAKAELDENEASRKQLYSDWKRNIGLKSGQALAPRDYEQAESSYVAMDRRVERLRNAYVLMQVGPRQERVAAARGDVRLAEADLAKAKWRLSNCKVVAPLTGTILTKKAEEGNIINPSAFSNGLSASLCDMADLSDLEVDMTIQERDIARVLKGQRCRIRAEAYPDRLYEGTVARLMPIADRGKGAVPVRVKVRVPRSEEGVYLKPEMSVLVSFLK